MTNPGIESVPIPGGFYEWIHWANAYANVLNAIDAFMLGYIAPGMFDEWLEATSDHLLDKCDMSRETYVAIMKVAGWNHEGRRSTVPGLSEPAE